MIFLKILYRLILTLVKEYVKLEDEEKKKLQEKVKRFIRNANVKKEIKKEGEKVNE